MENRKIAAAKALYLLLALAIAVSIWVYVDEFGNGGGPFSARQEVTDIPIEYTGEEALAARGLMLLEDGTTQSVDITFVGARRQVAALDRSRVRLTADLSGVTDPGVQTVRYTRAFLDENGRATYPASQRYSSVTVSSSDPESAVVNISRLASKEVDVRCELVGTVAQGYSAGQIQLSQTTLEVQGQETDIAPVAYAKATLDIGDGAEETVSRLLTCQFYDENGAEVSRENLYVVTDQVQVTLPVYITKELTLRVNFTDAAGARLSNTVRTIQPETVTVSGEAALLRDVDSITLGDLDLLELAAQGTGMHTYHYPIVVPDGCENLSGVSQATMQIAFQDLVVTQVDATRFAIDVEALDGKSVDILTERLPVTIFGTRQAVSAVGEADITVTPALSDYAAASGVYTVSAAVSIRNAGDVGVSGDYQVQVRIEDMAQETEGTENAEANASQAAESDGTVSGEASADGAASAGTGEAPQGNETEYSFS